MPLLVVGLAACGARSRSRVDFDDALGDADADTDSDGDADSDTATTSNGSCDTDPAGEGCPCESLEPILCYEGPLESRGIGECRQGLRSCAAGRWSACEGQGLPVEEQCNALDDDCDGLVDEEVTNVCGLCDGCEAATACYGDGCEAFPLDAEDEGVALGGDGRTLELAEGYDRGRWTAVLELGPGDASWGCVSWEASGERVEVELRNADEPGALADARPESFDAELATPPDPAARFMRVTVDLVDAGDRAPSIIQMWIVREAACE